MRQNHFVYAYWIASLGLLLTISTGCSMNRQLANHREILAEAAYDPNLSAEQKLDIMGQDMVRALDQALDKLNPKRGGQYLVKYFEQNDRSMNAILDELDAAVDEMGTGRQAMFLLRQAGKPWVRQLLQQLPRIERKYQTVRTLARIGSMLKLPKVGSFLKN